MGTYPSQSAASVRCCNSERDDALVDSDSEEAEGRATRKKEEVVSLPWNAPRHPPRRDAGKPHLNRSISSFTTIPLDKYITR